MDWFKGAVFYEVLVRAFSDSNGDGSGDEIGMGDNIWLADSDAVRTPMQWIPDRNAGFTPCDPGRIYLP